MNLNNDIYQTLEYIYDKYSPMMYGIALQIYPTENEAENILISTFKKIYEQNLIRKSSSCLCVTLIQLTIQTAREQLNDQINNDIKLKQFENAPLLNELLCKNNSIEPVCLQSQLTKKEVANKIREEIINLEINSKMK